MRIVLLCDDENYGLVHPLSLVLSKTGKSVLVIRLVKGFGNQLFTVTTEAKTDSGIEEITVSISCRWCRGLKFGSPILLKLLNFKLKPLNAKIEQAEIIHLFGKSVLGGMARTIAQRCAIPLVHSPNTLDLISGKVPFLLSEDVKSGSNMKEQTLILEADFLKKYVPEISYRIVEPWVAIDGLNHRPKAMGSSLNFLMAGNWNDELPVIARPKLAIKALAAAERELGKPVILGIIGSGTRISELKLYCASLGIHTQFHGDLSLKDMAREFQKADGFLHPTDFATFPNFMIQALKCGVPVLASQVEGIEAYLTAPEQGILVENKLSAWKEAFLQFANTEFDNSAVANQHKETFTFESHVVATLQVYDSLQLGRVTLVF
jgi:glycosyltransferase involved in cell wall biosynthesis